jgi:hypothetical protein
MKHIDPEQLILYHYGELDGGASEQAGDRPAIEVHLAACDHCRAERDALALTLAAVSRVPLPERAPNYEEGVWQRLAPRLADSGSGILPAGSVVENAGWKRKDAGWKPAPQKTRWLGVFPGQRWAWGGALAALLVAAFFAGGYWAERFSAPKPAPRPGTPAAISAQARNRVLLAAVADHMERSEILLMELENAGAGRGKKVDISWQREQAQELAAGTQLYEQAAEQAGESGLASLLDDLGRLLLTVAHSPSRVSRAELAVLRNRIEGPGLIFKLQVVDSGIEQRLKPESPRSTSGNVQD